MSRVDEAILDVKKELFNQPVVKEYFRLKELIEKDAALNDLIQQRKQAQLMMCKNENNDKVYFKNKEIYEKLDLEIRNNPLIINFNQVENEVHELLLEIKEILEK